MGTKEGKLHLFFSFTNSLVFSVFIFILCTFISVKFSAKVAKKLTWTEKRGDEGHSFVVAQEFPGNEGVRCSLRDVRLQEGGGKKKNEGRGRCEGGGKETKGNDRKR